MYRRIKDIRMILVPLLTVLSLLTVVAVTQGMVLSNEDVVSSYKPADRPESARLQQYTTVITVTTASDPDDNQKYVCYSTAGMVGKEIRSPCTLRQAIEESENLDDNARPILIRFDIADSESHNGAGDYWVIQLAETGQLNALPYVGSQTAIDGDTQPGGRSDGPKIIVRGPEKVPNGYGMVLEDDSTIRGLAFQRLRMHIQLNGSNNVVEDNWFGLSDDGQDAYLRDSEHPEDGSGQSGISTADNNTNNRVQNNHLTHFRAAAINVRGDDSFVLSNTVGTRVDGTVPDVRADRKCKSNAFGYNWFAGAGINVSGHNNQVENNRVVGMLFRSEDPFNTPDNALDISGHDHIVRNNIIGLTSDNVPFGTCGEGIHVGGIMGAHYIEIRDNHIVGVQGEAGIKVTGGPYGYDVDAVTVQGNVIEDSAHEAFKFGETLPSDLRFFNPASVTSIATTATETVVEGTSGIGSPCPECTIELFLDKYDTVIETLESLAVVTADANGDWTATIPGHTLALTEGLRTASTTITDGQIPHPNAPNYTYHAGMTTKISDLYTQTGSTMLPPPADPGPYQPITETVVSYSPPPTLPRTYTTTYTTIITVTSAGDPDDSQSYICYDEQDVLGTKLTRSPCTLRQAIEEAEELGKLYGYGTISSPFPILISFNISTTDNYDPTGQYWTIQLTETGQTNALPYLSDMTAIVGDTQPGGRTDGPKIIVRGPEKVPAGYGLVVDSDSYIQGLAFQRLRMHLQLNGGGNIIEDNWFGLTSDGQGIYLRDTEHPEDGSGQSGITTVENVSGNLIKDNALAGFRGGAIALRSNDSYVVGNYIGVNANGVVPVDVPANRWCKPNARYVNWFGGAGISVSGKRAHIGGPTPEDGNLIAGLLIYGNSPFATPPTALDLNRQEHWVQNNIIGVDKNGQEIGTCGDGIVIDAPRTRVISNTVTRSGMIGLFSGGTRYNSNARTVQDNIVKDSTTLFEFGPGIPEELQIFTPTQVLSFSSSDTTISGVDGHENAPCPYCFVEVYLDDLDGVSETLELMTTATTDENGAWSADLPHTVAVTQGVRTAVTALNYGVIPNYDAGTTSRFSKIFSPTGAITIAPPEPTPQPPPSLPEISYAPAPTAPYHYTPTFNTILTVTTAGDPYEVKTDICYDEYNLPVYQPKSPCSLRRALLEAQKLAEQRPEALPILISFNISTTDHYDTAGGYWTITLTDTGDIDALPYLGSMTVLDGDTQPGGRTDAPKIIIRGPEKVPSGYGLKIYGQDNLVRGLAFQRLRMHMFVGDRGNIIEDNWFGLTSNGQEIYLRDPERPEDGSGQSGIIVAENIANILIQRNVLAGFRGGAMSVGSSDSYVIGNYIGTSADGIVPVDVTYNRFCQPNARYHNWFGGAGVDVYGKRNQVISNTLVGLLIRGEDPEATQPEALALYGRDHLVQSNMIGIDKNGNEIGTCGVGLRLKSDFSRFISNTIAHSGGYALYQAGTRYESNARTLQGNLVKDSDILLEFDPGIPEAFQIFTPTAITNIAVDAGSTTLSGVNGENAPCPYCQVEVFIDDLDDKPELLESIAVTDADADGNWSVTLNRALAITEGLRTASTPWDYGIIEPYYEAGSTSRFSELYAQDGAPTPPPAAEPAPVIPPAVPPITYTDPPTLPSTYNTVITVDTTDDSDTSSTKTCTSAGAGNCSLRFAINEASDLAANERPARIAFNIPTSDPGHTSGMWTISLNTNRALPPVEGGEVVIDGTSQPGYDGSRPVIILHRNSDSSTGAYLQMGETQFETGYGVQGLAFQGIGLSLGYSSVAQDNWLGLSDDGNAIYFYNDDVSKVNYAVIKANDHCLIKNNVLAGSSTVAVYLNGDDNVVEGNRIGTRANGTIDVTGVISDNICDATATSGNWFGGGGIDLAGYRNRIRNNTIVGLLIEGSATSTPPNAIDIGYGEYQWIEGNRIGVDANGAEIWTCGDGIKNYGSAYTRIFSNTVVNSFGSGIYIEGRWWDSNANTLQGSVISNSIRAIYFGDLVPDELALFSPGLVTVISGTDVTGISDDDCPYCYVDVYLDDDDPWTEALEYWGRATTDGNGDWSLTLPRALGANEGLRTLSTVRNYGVIKYYEIGSSSKLSVLFQPQPPTGPSSVQIITPTGTLWTDHDIYFVANVSPTNTTLPITYTWEATDLVSQTVRGGVERAMSFKWNQGGSKTIKVTATNAYGNVMDTATVNIVLWKPLSYVGIEGPTSGYTNTLYTFNVTPIPSDATTPMTYTWTPAPEAGQGTANVGYRWATTGTYTLTLVAQNIDDPVSDTHIINIEAPWSSCPRPLYNMQVTGPLSGYIGTPYTFTAALNPSDATNPFYTWSPEPNTGQAQAEAIYQWQTPGTYTITLEAANCGGSAVVQHVITIYGACVKPLTGVSIDGPTIGFTGTQYTFDAVITPQDANTPVNYTWTPAPDDGQDTAQVDYRWTTTGTYTIDVAATNCGGTVTATHEITIAEAAACVALTDISINGATTGTPGEYTFTTDITPPDATAPVYRWDNGDSTASSTRDLAEGTYTIAVTATNCTSALVTATHAITISAAPPTGTMAQVDTAGVTLIYTDAQGNPTIVVVPAGAVPTGTFTLRYVAMNTAAVTDSMQSGLAFANHAFDLTMVTQTQTLAYTFTQPILVTITYSAADVAGLSEQITLYRWYNSIWTEIAWPPFWSEAQQEHCQLHEGDNKLACELWQLSAFAMLGEEEAGEFIYLPVVVKNYSGG
jgi:hypothetical protein